MIPSKAKNYDVNKNEHRINAKFAPDHRNKVIKVLLRNLIVFSQPAKISGKAMRLPPEFFVYATVRNMGNAA